jgi:ParB family transcriptional regulator, chromosome partitioning protein
MELELQRREEERKAEYERKQKEYEVEQVRREKQRKARVSTLEHISERAPASFSATQMRLLLRLLIHLDHSFLEEVAAHFSNGDENSQLSDEEIIQAVLDGTADDKLTGLALRIVLSDHVAIPHESQPDLLIEAEQAFAPNRPKTSKAKLKSSSRVKSPVGKLSQKK